MEPFNKILNQLLTIINSSINDKITGINFLELIKFELIEKIKNIDQKIFDELKMTLLSQNCTEKKTNQEIFYSIKNRNFESLAVQNKFPFNTLRKYQHNQKQKCRQISPYIQKQKNFH